MSEVFEGNVLSASIHKLSEAVGDKTHSMAVTLQVGEKNRCKGIERLGFLFNEVSTPTVHLRALFEKEVEVRISAEHAEGSMNGYPEKAIPLSALSVTCDISKALNKRKGESGSAYHIR